jgi:hypothetical protein
MTDPGPDPVTEQWIFGGSVIHSGRRAHLWLDPTGRELVYAAQGSYAVGYVYDVHVTRQGDRVTRHGRPTSTGDTADDATRDSLAARHRATETTLDVQRRDRAARRDDPVERAIAHLCDLAARVPQSQRTAFAAYVAVRLARSWSAK